jgi:hypothetical protein
MRRNKVIISLIITLVFITGCSNFGSIPKPESKRGKPIPVLTTTVYSGNFSTEEIRGMWMTCSVGFKGTNSYYPLDFVWRHCDCYTDYVRKNYKNSDDLRAITPDGANTLKRDLITNCNLKFQQEFQNKQREMLDSV